MITEHDLQEAIAECEGERHPNANTCIKLAAFYTIRENLFPSQNTEEVKMLPGYSYSPPPDIVREEDVIGNYGDSDFLTLVAGKPSEAVWAVIDELMETLEIINPRLRDGVFRQLHQI